MLVYVLKRVLWMIPTLVGISLVTFLLMDLAPGDAVTAARQVDAVSAADAQLRAARVQRLMKLHGHVDEQGNKLPLPVRYWRWLKNACVLQFAGSPVGSERFRTRILDAVPVTLFVNALALLLALAVAIPLGTKTGMRPGSQLDRLTSGVGFVAMGIPEFLFATILMLVFCGGFFAPLLPNDGLGSPDAGQLSLAGRVWDLVLHLVLPVCTLALGYGVLLYRFLRESVRRAAGSDFVLALRGFGVAPAIIQRRVLRNGLSPIVTILGAMLPTLVGGTVVVERIFSLPGVGWLTTNAVAERDMPMVMALTMLVSVVTLVSLLVSDILQRVVDPRVELR